MQRFIRSCCKELHFDRGKRGKGRLRRAMYTGLSCAGADPQASLLPAGGQYPYGGGVQDGVGRPALRPVRRSAGKPLPPVLPLVASNYEMCTRAFDMAWAGIFYKTICTMEIHETSPNFYSLRDGWGAFYGFKNIKQLSPHSMEDDIEILTCLKQN